MKILFQGLRKAQNVALNEKRNIKFTTIVKTDFGESPVTIELTADAQIVLIEKFGIQKVNTKTSRTITESLTEANKLKLIEIIKGKTVSLQIK